MPLSLGVVTFVTMLGAGIIAPFLPLYAKHMGASGTTLGMIFAAFALARLLATPYVGELSDRHGRKPFLVAGLLWFAITALLYIPANTPALLVGVRFAQGLAAALVLPVAMALVADRTEPGNEGRGMAMFHTAFLMGWGVGPLLGGVIHDLQGFNANFLIMAGLSLLSTVLVIWKIKDPPRIQPAAQAKTGWRERFSVLADRELLAVFICRAGSAAQVGCLVAFLPLLGDSLGLSAWQVGGFITLNVAFMTLLQAPAGRLADRMARGPLVVSGQLISALGMAVLPFASSLWSLMALAVFMGLGTGLSLPAMTAIVVSRSKAQGAGMGLAMGVYNSAFSLGVVVGPVTAGVLSDLFNFHAAFYLAATLCAASALFLALAVGGRESPPLAAS